MAKTYAADDNHLIALAIAVFDVEKQFKTLAAGADREKALAILDRLGNTKQGGSMPLEGSCHLGTVPLHYNGAKP